VEERKECTLSGLISDKKEKKGSERSRLRGERGMKEGIGEGRSGDKKGSGTKRRRNPEGVFDSVVGGKKNVAPQGN